MDFVMVFLVQILVFLKGPVKNSYEILFHYGQCPQPLSLHRSQMAQWKYGNCVHFKILFGPI